MIKEFPINFSHYQILSIKSNADKKAIKSAFIKLSKKYHPDFNTTLTSQEKLILKKNYQRIIQSYKFLSNDSKRSGYDQTIRKSSNIKRTAQKTYYSGGINQTRRTYQQPHQQQDFDPSNTTYANFHRNVNPNYGANYDVPHFDFDNHLRGNLWFERRMINKRINTPSSQQKSQYSQYSKSSDNKRSIDDEINYTLNLQRFGSYQNQQNLQNELNQSKLVSLNLTTGKTAVLFMGILGIITLGAGIIN